MNGVNKTLYIPLYGKAFVSKKGIILEDKKAEQIWEAEGFPLKGKSKSKWLSYYMGMRAAVFDQWLKTQMDEDKDAIIIQIGCGMDSRVERVRTGKHTWYDVDFSAVITERKRYYNETKEYHMVESDARNQQWIASLPQNKKAIIVMEGVSMYFQLEELRHLLKELKNHFAKINVLMDCYTVLAAKASKYKNPINEVGVNEVYGVEQPELLEENTNLSFVKEHNMTPEYLINQLNGSEKFIFKHVFGGKFSRKMYRLYEYEGMTVSRTKESK